MSYKSELTNTKGIKIAEHKSQNYWKAVELRYDQLREPLGLRFTREQLLAETDDIHIVYKNGSYVLACLVLTPIDEQRIKMRQVAVDEELKGQGVGSIMVQFAEAHAKDLGYKTMECNARLSAVPFYKKLGYHTVGDMFHEVTIPHYHMVKALF